LYNAVNGTPRDGAPTIGGGPVDPCAGVIHGRSDVVRKLRREIDLVARSPFPVLVRGETGVGKEVVAHALHLASDRRHRPLVKVNCAAVPESLADSELFGHRKGAFTGANDDRTGRFEAAHGGTLFLDEIGELPLAIQAKLLRVLQDGEIQRVGDARPRYVDVRVVAATNRELDAEVVGGRFRGDLFHRLNAFPIRVPPLRERAEDLPDLCAALLERIAVQVGRASVVATPAALDAMAAAPWPGNVRELQNVLRRAALIAASEVPADQPVRIDVEHLGPGFVAVEPPSRERVEGDVPGPHRARSESYVALDDTPLPLREAVDQFQRRMIVEALEACDGKWAAAARRLGLDRSNLRHLALRLGIAEPRS